MEFTSHRSSYINSFPDCYNRLSAGGIFCRLAIIIIVIFMVDSYSVSIFDSDTKSL